jgi:glycosyltransferase involved in cell wall biosynthesis
VQESIEKYIKSKHIPIEFVIVNDGSTDATQNIGFMLLIRNRLINNDDNQGLFLSRNRGIQESKASILSGRIQTTYLYKIVNLMTAFMLVKSDVGIVVVPCMCLMRAV